MSKYVVTGDGICFEVDAENRNEAVEIAETIAGGVFKSVFVEKLN